MNTFDQMRDAIREANTTIVAADSVVSEMAGLIRGRLHKVNSPTILSMLKVELRDFNMVTGRWKGE